MRASMSSSPTTAALVAASAAIIIPGKHRNVYALNESCRSTTSTQYLSCLGVRCRPTYEGGCDDGEYTESSIQTSCTEPGDIEQHGAAVVCYYDDLCCPNSGGSGGEQQQQQQQQQGDHPMATTAGSGYGAGIPIEDFGGYDKDGNEDWEGAKNGNNEWEEAWTDMYKNDYPAKIRSSEKDGGNKGRAAGVAFAFVIVAVAAFYMFTMSKYNKRNEDILTTIRSIEPATRRSKSPKRASDLPKRIKTGSAKPIEVE